MSLSAALRNILAVALGNKGVAGELADAVDAKPDLTGNNVLTGTLKLGSSTADQVAVKGFYMNGTSIAVAVPSITDPDCAKVDVDISGSFTVQPAVGDGVLAIPQEALPTNARLGGAWVSATDQVTITFSSEGGNVVGANKNFKFFIVDLT